MTYEEKKRLLELYHDIVVDVMVINHECIELREDMLPSGIHYSDMPKAHNVHDPMAGFAARLDALENRQRFLIRGIRNIRDSVEDLDSGLRHVLSLYYLDDGYSWSHVAKLMKCSERGIRRRAHRAIADLRIRNVRNAKAILDYYSPERGEKGRKDRKA